MKCVSVVSSELRVHTPQRWVLVGSWLLDSVPVSLLDLVVVGVVLGFRHSMKKSDVSIFLVIISISQMPSSNMRIHGVYVISWAANTVILITTPPILSAFVGFFLFDLGVTSLILHYLTLPATYHRIKPLLRACIQ